MRRHELIVSVFKVLGFSLTLASAVWIGYRQVSVMGKQTSIMNEQSRLTASQLVEMGKANSLQKTNMELSEKAREQEAATKRLAFEMQSSQQNFSLLLASNGKNAFKIKKADVNSFFLEPCGGGDNVVIDVSLADKSVVAFLKKDPASRSFMTESNKWEDEETQKLCGGLYKDGKRQHFLLCEPPNVFANISILCDGLPLVSSLPPKKNCLKCEGERYVVDIYSESGLAKLRRKSLCNNVGEVNSEYWVGAAKKSCLGGKLGETIDVSL